MPFWLISAGSGLVVAALAVLLWVRRPAAPLWPIAFVCQICALLWIVGDLWASHASSLGEKQIALTLLFTGSIALPPLWWETCRRYVAWQGFAPRWTQSPLARLPLWFGGAAWLMMLSNPWHGQFIEAVVGGRNNYHWGVTVVFYTHWCISLTTCALCAWAAFRHPETRVRKRMTILAAATLAPLGTNYLHFALPGMPTEDPVAIGLGLTNLTVFYGVVRTRLFNLLPIGLNQILHSDPSGVLLLDRGGRLLLWNPAAEKLFDGVLLEPELALPQVLASRLLDGETGRPLQDANALIERLVATGESSQPVTFRYRGGGGERWLRVWATPIPGRRQRIAAVCLRIEEVTAEERVARNLRTHGQRMHEETATTLRLMAAGVAHDLNNVLFVIDGRTHLALDDARSGLPLKRHLDTIAKASRVARGLTQQLKIASGHAVPDMCLVDISQLVADAQELLTDTLPPRTRLRMELAESLPDVVADDTQLFQALLNLVKNAGEAVRVTEGEVLISTHEVRVGAGTAGQGGAGNQRRPAPGDYVCLDVADDGAGLDEHERNRLFDHSFSTGANGGGLGLAIVRQVVESNGGTITVESRRGQGTRFRVWLPV